MTDEIDWQATANAETAWADREYPPDPPKTPDPEVRAGMLRAKLGWLGWWSRLTGADVRPDIEYWRRMYGG